CFVHKHLYRSEDFRYVIFTNSNSKVKPAEKSIFLLLVQCENIFKVLQGLRDASVNALQGLRDASVNALQGLASIDPDIIWLLIADVYYSLKKKDMPSPPTSDIPEILQIPPPSSSPKESLYVQYGGQSYGFDVDFHSL
ncbi:unnamed protein product, partial [Prunus brigantina]